MKWGLRRGVRACGIAALHLVPALLFAYHVWYFVAGPARIVDVGIGWIAPVLLLVGLAYATYRYRHDPVPAAERARLGGWIVVGTTVLGGAGLGGLYYQIAIGATVFDLQHAALSWATGGALIGLVVGMHDVERQRALREAVTAKHRAERYGERLHVLNRVLRHDIRNQVTAVSGYASLIADGDGDPRRDAEAIQRHAAAIADLGDRAREIEQLLDRDGLDAERLDLDACVVETIDSLRERYPAVTFDVQRNGAAEARGSTLVDSAVRHVVTNAIEHNDTDGPTVSIALEHASEPTGEWVDLVVTDNGPGIPARERSIHQSRVESPLEHSTGLGLWLADWVVTESGGSLSIDRTGPDGSAVRLRLPAAN